MSILDQQKVEDPVTWSFECCKPCHVVLKRLTEEEIKIYTSVRNDKFIEGNQDKSYRPQKKFSKHYFRDLPRLDCGLFSQYKRSRQKFLDRKSHRISTDIPDFNESSEELGTSSEEFGMDTLGSSSIPRKKKKLTYEDDMEWSPNLNSKHNSIERRILRKQQRIGLRVNPRRKRIESNSSSSSDEDFDDFFEPEEKKEPEKLINPAPNKEIYNPDMALVAASTDKSKKKNVNSLHIQKPFQKESNTTSALLDHDVLSKIMQEMADYSEKNRKQVNKTLQVNKPESYPSNIELTHYPRVKKRQSRIFKITDEGLTPSVTSVQQVVKNMVNAVCTSEKTRLAAADEIKKKKCKWCDSLYRPNSGKDGLCPICLQVVKRSNKSLNKTAKKEKSSTAGTSNKIKNPKISIKSNLLKNLPKYDQQRLAYSGKVNRLSTEKGYNHCKSLATAKCNSNDLMVSSEVPEGESVNKNPFVPESEKLKIKKKKKVKGSLEGASLNSKVIKKKKKMLPMPEKITNVSNITIPPPVSKILKKAVVIKPKQVSVTNVDKGLFLMTFPDPHQELEIPLNAANTKSLSASDNNVATEKSITDINTQSELLQNKPKQLLINNAQYGTYLLPPVPTVVVANYAATDAKSGDYYLSSVYYQNEMTQSRNIPLRNENAVAAANSVNLPSMPSIEQLSRISPSPATSITQTYQINSLTSANSNFRIDVPNTVLINQQMIPHTNISSYSSQSNLSNIYSNSNMNISPATYQSSPTVSESNIASLFHNTQLQIETIPSKTSHVSFRSFENPEFTSFEDNLAHIPQDYNEDNFDEPSRESSSNNSDVANFDNAAVNPLKQSNQSNNEETDNNQDSDKVPEQNMDSNQNSSLPSSNPEEHISYQSEIQNLSSEALLDYCSAELDALCILSVLDLDRNPKWSLNHRIDSNKSEYEKLKNAVTQDGNFKERLKHLELTAYILQIASTLLNKFGSFSRLSDSLLRKARINQIKKEKNQGYEETRSSCQFAQSGPIQSPLTSVPSQQSKPKENVPPITRMKEEEASSCSFGSESSVSVNHIEKIQTQIQAMQRNSSLAEEPAHSGVVHHFPAPDMSISNAAMSVTPRTEMMNEFRETPSRGSGPRTPARPESALSQNDESIVTPVQIKKERLETSNPGTPLSQCAFSQSTPSPQLSVAPPLVSQVAPPVNNLSMMNIASTNSPVINALNQRFQTVAPNVSINNNNPQIQKVVQFQQGQAAPPNVTIPFSGNQNISKVLLNIASTHSSSQNVSAAVNPANPNLIIRNGQVYNVQQVYLPQTPNVTQRYVQPSSQAVNNMNQYNIYKRTMSSGGTMLMNNIGQNNYSLSTSVTSAPVLNSQQVSQVCNTGNFQQPIQQVPNTISQASPSTAYLMPNNKQSDSTIHMSCAVCDKPATLRCKQCAKVAYCNTLCAKTYWHAKHKMECKLMSG